MITITYGLDLISGIGKERKIRKKIEEAFMLVEREFERYTFRSGRESIRTKDLTCIMREPHGNVTRYSVLIFDRRNPPGANALDPRPEEFQMAIVLMGMLPDACLFSRRNGYRELQHPTFEDYFFQAAREDQTLARLTALREAYNPTLAV